MSKSKPPAPIQFTKADRRRLARALRRTREARVYRRLQALRLVAEGRPVSAVAQVLGISRQAVSHWRAQYGVARRPEALQDAPRSGRPRGARRLTPARILRALRRDPLRLGYTTTVWTVALLAHELNRRYGCAITPRTLRRRMKELGLRWKRPRYVYRVPEPHLAQKKGRLSAA